MPKDRVFYSLFEEIANTVAKMGTVLKQVVCEPNFDRRAQLFHNWKQWNILMMN